MSFLTVQLGAKNKHYHKGWYYQKLPSVDVSKPDIFDNATPIMYGYVKDEKVLNYYSAHIAIHQKDIVIETFAEIDVVIKSKITLENGKTYQVRDFTDGHIEVSRVSSVTKHVISLG